MLIEDVITAIRPDLRGGMRVAVVLSRPAGSTRLVWFMGTYSADDFESGTRGVGGQHDGCRHRVFAWARCTMD
jgi:hypothetical protein